MKIIQPSVEFLGAVPTDYAGTVKFIERAGRTCYKSEDKITEDSAEKFVRKLISAGHLAMVEHSNFVVRTSAVSEYDLHELAAVAGKFLTVTDGHYYYVGGSLTAWAQRCARCYFASYSFPAESVFVPFLSIYKDLFSAQQFSADDCGEFFGDWEVCPHDEIPQELHRYSAKFICDRGVSHELVRHRPCSFAQESTRYVNYGGKDIEFIEPDGFETWPLNRKKRFEYTLRECVDGYMGLIAFGCKLQQARAVLPNALKTEIIVTADLKEWQHIFKLRCAPSAHPDFVRLAVDLRRQFEEAGLPCKPTT